jgi:superfamily I DNA/RNA helicase/RecB family exonuclease
MAVSRRAPAYQLDPNQQAAIEHITSPMLVVAGAGTGKTTVLIRRIANLIRQGQARPHQILALTYTNNAAREMLDRVERELSGEDIQGLQVCTFHAYSNELLIRAGREFRVLDDQQLWIFLRRHIRELELKYYIRAASVGEFLKDLLEFMRRCHDELVSPEQYRAYLRRLEHGELTVPRVSKSRHAAELSQEEVLGRCHEIASVFEKVEGMLGERNFGTFGHMIVRAHQLLHEDLTVLARAQAAAKFILVDEFQDANFAQIKVLQKLAGEKGNIFAVGDPDQGIYRFRGASSGAFELFQQQFPGSELLVLNQNRRSTSPILKCAHALVSSNPEFSLRAGEHRYRRSPLISVRDQGDPNKAATRSRVEAVLVSGKLIEATDAVSLLIEHQRRTRSEWKQIAVLYRSHFHRDEIASELARHGIPFSIEGLDVMDTPEARDLLACLGAVVSPRDSAAWLRLAALPQFSVDPNELRVAMKSSPYDAKLAMTSVLETVTGGELVLASVDRAVAEIAGKKTFAALLTLTKIFQLQPRPALQALLEFANLWERSPITETGTPAEFLDYLELFREAGGIVPLSANDTRNAVRLMTVHSAKGLEFDHVFILRAVSNSFPAPYREALIELPNVLRNSRLERESDEKEIFKQEERRLFYVAMTRARDSLTIYGKFGRGQNDNTPPGFLREMINNRQLKDSLTHRVARAFQTEIFPAPEPSASSPVAAWIALPTGPDVGKVLSASAIQRYEICPLQFKLEREWHIPAEVSAALQYGAAMHRALLSYYLSRKQNRRLDESALFELFRADLASAGVSDRYQHELYEAKGMAELHGFFSSAESARAEVLHTEQQFRLRIGATELVGRIDRIDRNADGAIVIIDYKTGRPKSQQEADESLQLSLYALAAREKWGYRAEYLVFHNLEGNTTVITKRSDAEIEQAKLRVEQIAEKIGGGQFEAVVGNHCAFCAYRSLCPKTERPLPQLLAVAAECK